MVLSSWISGKFGVPFSLPLLEDPLPGVVVPDGICPPSHQPDEYGTRPFLRWIQAQGRSPHAPGISKNASDPSAFPLKGAPQAPDDKPNPSFQDG